MKLFMILSMGASIGFLISLLVIAIASLNKEVLDISAYIIYGLFLLTNLPAYFWLSKNGGAKSTPVDDAENGKD